MSIDRQWKSIPARSRLTSLCPIEVGTADTESLTSYVTELAKASAVSVRYLLSEEVYCDEKRRVWSNWMVRAATTNGSGTEARRMVDTLANLTGQPSLCNLTLLPFERILAPRPHVLKRGRAWCGPCLEAMRIQSERCDDGSRRIYEKLVWAIAPVVVCPIHKQQLQTRCPHCLQQQRILTANSVPGYCNKCVRWLGAPHSLRSEPGSEEDLWIATTIGDMVAAAPHADPESLIAQYRRAIIRQASRVAGGSIRALSRLSGIRYSQIMNCLRDNKTVAINLFLKGLYGLNLSVRDLLQEPTGSIERDQPCQIGSNVAPRYRADFRRLCLQLELNSPQPRSPRVLAFSLGYGGTAQLWRADRDLFRELAQKASSAERLSLSAKSLAELKDRARQALESTLAESPSRSVKQVAKELDIKEGTLRGWFPELCRWIASKRDDGMDQACRTGLEKALEEIPVPSLSEVARRAGKTLAILETRTPDLCRDLRNAKASHARNQTESLRERVIPFLTKDPPPTGAEVSRQLETPWGAIKRQLPDLARQLVKRAKSSRQKESMLCEMTVFDEVEKAVNKLHSIEEYPSAARIADETANLPQNWSLLNDARKRAIAKFRDSSTDSPADDNALSATFAKAQAKTC